VEPGGVLLFGGRSGCGKSSLLEICAGLVRPSAGSVLWDGDVISDMSKYELYGKRKCLGYVFQVNALISNHSVFDNIALPLKCGASLSGAEIREKVKAQMDELEISGKIDKKFPEALSAAQLRSVALARALISSPKLLILDEPMSCVDPFTASMIINVLHKRWKRDGMTVIMAAHSINAWPEWDAGRYMLKDGRLEPAAAEGAFAKVRDIRYNQRFVYGK
jgi:ABC-type transporter Mla maintaining outer membrane lipid asymmetry ATPase subunit MlaF